MTTTPHTSPPPPTRRAETTALALRLDHSENALALRALTAGQVDAILVANRGGAILSQSQSVSRLLGYESEELVGSSIIKLIHKEDFSRFYSAFFSVIEGIRPDAIVEFRHRTRDGSYRMLEATLSKLRDVSVASVVLACRDTTSQPPGRTPLPAETDATPFITSVNQHQAEPNLIAPL